MPNHRNVYISLATSMSKTGKFQLTPLVYWKFHLVLNVVNFKSHVDGVDMVEFGYHGEWYTLLIIDIIDWNDLEKICI